MPFLKIIRLTTGSVANGASKEDKKSSPHKYKLVGIFVTPRGNSVLTNVQFYADIDGVPIFDPDIPADLLDPLNPSLPKSEWAWEKGSYFNYKLTNNSGAAETYDISLVCLSETWPPA